MSIKLQYFRVVRELGCVFFFWCDFENISMQLTTSKLVLNYKTCIPGGHSVDSFMWLKLCQKLNFPFETLARVPFRILLVSTFNNPLKKERDRTLNYLKKCDLMNLENERFLDLKIGLI